MGEAIHTIAYAQSWPDHGGPEATHHIYRDAALPGGVVVHQHVEPDSDRTIWIPDGVWNAAVKREAKRG